MKIAYFAAAETISVPPPSGHGMYENIIAMQTYVWNDLTKQIISPEGMVLGTAETVDAAQDKIKQSYIDAHAAKYKKSPIGTGAMKPIAVTYVCSIES